MRTGFEQLCLSHLPQLGLKPAKKGLEEKNGVGFTFVPEPGVGEGLSVDLPYQRSLLVNYLRCGVPPGYVLPLSPPRRSDGCGQFSGQRGACAAKALHQSRKTWWATFWRRGPLGIRFPQNTPVRSIGIGLMPEFYEQQLPALMGQDATQIRKAACALDGTVSLPEVEALLHQMAAYLPQAGTAGLRYEAKVFDLLAALLEWNDLTLSTPTAACISAKDQESLQSLKYYLLQNYSAKVDLQRLAQMCYMSKSKLTYLFRMLYGTTIYEFILACRIDRAKELLADREKKISEIAALVGYERQSSFSAAFHQKTGITPNEFRRQFWNK